MDPSVDGSTNGASRAHPTARARLGAAGERLAAQLLERQGMTILARNWRCVYGEIDLVATEGPELVFVEVKTRRGARAGSPEEAITPTKQRRLIAAAQSYLVAREAEDHPYRIDVVAVDLTPGGQVVQVRHHRRAIAEE